MFKDFRFPPLVSLNYQGGPRFKTDIVGTDGGYESSNQNWELELNEFDVSYQAKLPAQWRPLFSFFRNVRGRGNTFRYKDWLDYEVTSAEGRFTLLTATTFQLWKIYVFEGSTYWRKITKPISPIVVTGGTVSTIAYATGIVTMTSGTPTAWSGEFDLHCRLDIDGMSTAVVGKKPKGGFLVTWDSIPIREVRD